MTKEDCKIVISSATGRNVYIEAMISRTVARKVETLLEQNNVIIPVVTDDHGKDVIDERLADLYRQRKNLLHNLIHGRGNEKYPLWEKELDEIHIKIAEKATAGENCV